MSNVSEVSSGSGSGSRPHISVEIQDPHSSTRYRWVGGTIEACIPDSPWLHGWHRLDRRTEAFFQRMCLVGASHLLNRANADPDRSQGESAAVLEEIRNRLARIEEMAGKAWHPMPAGAYVYCRASTDVARASIDVPSVTRAEIVRAINHLVGCARRSDSVIDLVGRREAESRFGAAYEELFRLVDALLNPETR